MYFYHLLLLALVQGITEFLPVSSSGHLVLTRAVLNGEMDGGWQRTDVIMDVAVHLGTLFAVLLYFRKDVVKMAAGAAGYIFRGRKSEEGRIAWYVFIASLPVFAAGFILAAVGPAWVRSAEIVALATICFGLLLGYADLKAPLHAQSKPMTALSLRHAVFIGLAQMTALIPGTSRSGITMTAARLWGYSRVESARFSLYLSIPAIAGAAGLSLVDLLKERDSSLGYEAIVALVLAFFSGWMSIGLMLKWLSRSSFMPFVIYRVVLGAGLLLYLYWPL